MSRPRVNITNVTSRTCKLCVQDLPIASFELLNGTTRRWQCEPCRHQQRKAAKASKSPKAKNKTPIIQEKPVKAPMKPISHPEEMPDLLKHIASVLKNLLERVDLLEQSINNNT